MTQPANPNAPVTTRDFCLQADALTEAAKELESLRYTINQESIDPANFVQTWLTSRALRLIGEAARRADPNHAGPPETMAGHV